LQALFTHTRESDDVEVHELVLKPLSDDESVLLAKQLLGPTVPTAAAGVGRESGGNPHLLTELARHVLLRNRTGTASLDTQRGSVTFERAVMKRVAELSPGAQTLLELLSVAGRPLTEDSLALLATFDIDLQQALTELRGAKLVRGAGTHAGRALETYHDRVREAVVDAMDPERLALLHKRLASTLEASGSEDLEAIVDHLLGARDFKRAQVYAIRAATQAADALAFDKAARLFAIAVEHEEDPGWGHELLVRWGDALVNAGRGRQAAAVYVDAANAALAPEAAMLRAKAGLQLLASGHEQEALGFLEPVLSPMLASAAALDDQASSWLARLSQRGLVLSPWSASTETLARLDAAWALALGATLCGMSVAPILCMRYLYEALESGDAPRALRGLCLFHARIEHSALATERPPGQAPAPRVSALTMAERLQERLDLPYGEAALALVKGLDALLQRDGKQATRLLARAEETFRSRCPGSAVEMRFCRTALSLVFATTCEIERMRAVIEWADEAQDHEDLLAEARLRLLASLGALAADRPDRVERALVHAVARLNQERADADPAAFLQLHVQSLAVLYRGDAERAALLLPRLQAWLESARAPSFLRSLLVLQRARVVLLASHAGEQESRLVQAEDDARALLAEHVSYFERYVRLLRAAIAFERNDLDTTTALLEAALADPGERTDAAFTAAAARRRKGELLGGEQGQALVASADFAASELGVKNPEAFARLFSPRRVRA
jgi:hypothetical protein